MNIWDANLRASVGMIYNSKNIISNDDMALSYFGTITFRNLGIAFFFNDKECVADDYSVNLPRESMLSSPAMLGGGRGVCRKVVPNYPILFINAFRYLGRLKWSSRKPVNMK